MKKINVLLSIVLSLVMVVASVTFLNAELFTKVNANELNSAEDVQNAVSVNNFAAATNVPTIVVSSGTALTGKQVQVTISLENNPGFVSMLLNVNYDTTKLQLVSVDDKGKLGASFHSDSYKNPYTLNWVNDTATENITYNGNVVVLTFNVLKDAALGETPVTVTYDYDDYGIIDKDLNSIRFEVVDCVVEIVDMIVGDVNADAKVNQLDRVILTRHLAHWDGYDTLPYNG